ANTEVRSLRFDVRARAVVLIANQRDTQAAAASPQLRKSLEDAPMALDVGPRGDHGQVNIALDDLWRGYSGVDPPIRRYRHGAQIHSQTTQEGMVARFDRLNDDRVLQSAVHENLRSAGPGPAWFENDRVPLCDGIEIEETSERREDVGVVDD